MAATFLAIFFVPWFFRVIFERRLSEPRTREELHTEIDHARELAARLPPPTPGHPPQQQETGGEDA